MTEPNETKLMQENIAELLDAVKIKSKEKVKQKELERTECRICKKKFKKSSKCRKHYFVEHKLEVKKKSNDNIIDPALKQIEYTCNKLLQCNPGFEFLELKNLIQPSPEEINIKLNKITYDIKRAISNTCSNFELYLFGSCVTGLAFNESDVDFYLHTNNKSDKIQTLNHLKNELFASRKFSKIVAIFAAKIPLVKCFHNETKLYIDITNANGLGCCNSNFIRFIMNFDSRIYPLTLVIKYWAKCHYISKTGRLTNYCLTIMIIFYLQTLKQPILPTIYMIQQYVPEYCIGSWNLAFNTNAPNLSQNQSNTIQLIIGFFNYYNNFDFENDIICTLYGRVYKKSDFKTLDVVPKEFDRMIKHIVNNNDNLIDVSKPMCIQDPFELNRNISNLNLNFLNLIKSHFKLATNILCECSAKESSIAELLARLFTEQVTKTNLVTFAKSFATIPLPSVRYFLSMNKTNVNSDKVLEMEKLWTKKLPEILMEILTKIFFLKLTLNNDYNNTNATNTVSPPESDTSSSITIQYYDVYAEYDVWTDRKIPKEFDNQLINEEIKISNSLLAKKKKTNIKCVLKLVSKNYNFIGLQLNESEAIQESGTKSLTTGIKKCIRFFINPYFDIFYKQYLTE